MQVKTPEKDAYTSVQLGFGVKKHANKSLLGHAKKANSKTAPRVMHEVRLRGEAAHADMLPEIGTTLAIADIFKLGDTIKVTGTSKGKGFAGVVKRHHFRGGPRTHGQSDRERAPGSIGQTTTPGRVYKGKRMAGHMGNVKAAVTNLEVLDIDPTTDELFIKGLVPGSLNSIVVIEKMGEVKKFVPLTDAYKAAEVQEAAASDSVSDEPVATEAVEEVNTEAVESGVETATEEVPVVEEASVGAPVAETVPEAEEALVQEVKETEEK
jgi:large subunit ribosomal protein L3